jgi:hypothetical protein
MSAKIPTLPTRGRVGASLGTAGTAEATSLAPSSGRGKPLPTVSSRGPSARERFAGVGDATAPRPRRASSRSLGPAAVGAEASAVGPGLGMTRGGGERECVSASPTWLRCCGRERCVRDARPQGRDPGALAPPLQRRAETWRDGGSAQLATVVSWPTARAARPGAQRRDTPKTKPFRRRTHSGTVSSSLPPHPSKTISRGWRRR